MEGGEASPPETTSAAGRLSSGSGPDDNKGGGFFGRLKEFVRLNEGDLKALGSATLGCLSYWGACQSVADSNYITAAGLTLATYTLHTLALSFIPTPASPDDSKEVLLLPRNDKAREQPNDEEQKEEPKKEVETPMIEMITSKIEVEAPKKEIKTPRKEVKISTMEVTLSNKGEKTSKKEVETPKEEVKTPDADEQKEKGATFSQVVMKFERILSGGRTGRPRATLRRIPSVHRRERAIELKRYLYQTPEPSSSESPSADFDSEGGRKWCTATLGEQHGREAAVLGKWQLLTPPLLVSAVGVLVLLSVVLLTRRARQRRDAVVAVKAKE